jgi:hypothetical protein
VAEDEIAGLNSEQEGIEMTDDRRARGSWSPQSQKIPVVVNGPVGRPFPRPADGAPNIGLLWCSKIHKWLVRRGRARREILVRQYFYVMRGLFDPGYFVSRLLPEQACRAHKGRPLSALIIAIDCLLVTSVDNATTGLHLRRWPCP